MTQLLPGLRAAMNDLYAEAVSAGLHPRITSTVRSRRRQAQLFRAWQQGRSRYPAARPGSSLHEFGYAFDMVADDLPRLGRLWESWGGTWGGRFNDNIHFQVRLSG